MPARAFWFAHSSQSARTARALTILSLLASPLGCAAPAADQADLQIFARSHGQALSDDSGEEACVQAGLSHVIRGTDADDELEGTPGDDCILGLGGHDLIFGGAGNDLILSGDGDDRITGDDGDDVIVGGRGADRILGREGDDTLLGGEGDDWLDSGPGTDELFGETGDDLLVGGAGRQVLTGGEGNDALHGAGEADLLRGGPGDDFLGGGEGDDRLEGEAGQDYLEGYLGHDWLDGGSEVDTLYGDEGDDRLFALEGADLVHGGAGADYIEAGAAALRVYGEDCHDVIHAQADPDYVHGGSGHDACEAAQCEVAAASASGCASHADCGADMRCIPSNGLCVPLDAERCERDDLPSCTSTSSNDASCDGIDDNCDGQIDEGFVGAVTQCGVGACAVTGSTHCVNGLEVDSCVAAPAGGSDNDCDGVDDDCDGLPDDDDSDSDGAPDCLETCPEDPDGDCIIDARDLCPDDLEQRCTAVLTLQTLVSSNRGGATAISGNGLVVVGWSDASTGAMGFRWTEEEGIEGLGYGLAGIPQRESSALAVSFDGSSVAGWTATLDQAFQPARLGFLWKRSTNMQLIPGYSKVVKGMSADGSLLVGWGGNWSTTYQMAAAWDGQLTSTGFGPYNLPFDNSESITASADGSTVLGTAMDYDQNRRVAYLASRNLSFLTQLPDLAGGAEFFYPYDMASDASVVVGVSSNANGQQPVRWTQATGTVSLGSLNGASSGRAVATSSDGSVIVGVSGSAPFLWTAARGIRSLLAVVRTLSPTAFEGFTEVVPSGISDTGRRIVGSAKSASGVSVAWLLQLGEDFAL